MSRKLAVTQRQAETLARAAKAEGCVVEIETAIGTIRLVPPELASKQKDSRPVDGGMKGYL